ncbi:MAG: DUF1080 domain-containing protein [Opitutaceae bacterium]|nr:DUF1080 domain-containing protein [Opitutaceae bacterium]
MGAFSVAAALAQSATPEGAPKADAASKGEVWAPVPPIVAVSPVVPPSDAIVLFSGDDLHEWASIKNPGMPAPWLVKDRTLVIQPKSGSIVTRQSFGDLQLHLEFRIPLMPDKAGQSRGNSGIFFMNLYELQILDSCDNPTYVNGQCGAFYKQSAPLVNPTRAPGEWQSYDVIWIRPRFSKNGELIAPARGTVLLNGVLVQNNFELWGPTLNRGRPAYKAHAAELPIALQDHNCPVAFRNIWVRRLE